MSDFRNESSVIGREIPGYVRIGIREVNDEKRMRIIQNVVFLDFLNPEMGSEQEKLVKHTENCCCCACNSNFRQLTPQAPLEERTVGNDTSGSSQFV